MGTYSKFCLDAAAMASEARVTLMLTPRISPNRKKKNTVPLSWNLLPKTRIFHTASFALDYLV
jgi:hypothetical protein